MIFTLECSGNHGFAWNPGLIGTARWAGTPLAPLLAEAGVLAAGREVVFWGADAGEETVRDVAMPPALRPQHVPGGRHGRQPPAVRTR